jgi:hypothetical protein
MMESPEPAVVIDALNKIVQLADATPASRHIILNENCLGKLMAISQNENELVAKGAMICLSILSETGILIRI